MRRDGLYGSVFIAVFVVVASGALNSSAEAQGLQVEMSGSGSGPGAPAAAASSPRSDRRLKASLLGEAGWRWVALGHSRIPRNDDTFNMAFHAGLRLDVGGPVGGFYSYARFDGYAPTGYGTFPWSGQVRLGYFRNVHYWDAGGPRSSTSTSYSGTSCGYATCYDHYTTTTRSWWEPAGWVNGLRYFYVAGHYMDGTRTVPGARTTQVAGSVGVGLGIVETKLTTWFAETELLVFPLRQWEDERSRWGYYLRAGSIFGPVFIDVTLLLDPAVGGELSVGAGFMLGG
jgi:hypothetical protein